MIGASSRVPIKTRKEIELMRVSARHTAEILLEVRELAKPGATTQELERAAAESIKKRGVGSSFKGYAPHGLPPYPAVICISINEEIVHGIPGPRELRDGDLLSLDFGVYVNGYHGDSAVTIPIGEVSAEARDLLETTRESLYRGIEQMVPGNRLNDIGHAVEGRAKEGGYAVVREFVGHGIGRKLHEPPQIPNFGEGGTGPRLLPGMVFAIEPMLNMGVPDVNVLEDQWTAVTADGELSAHFEHTILITDEGPEILTRISGSH